MTVTGTFTCQTSNQDGFEAGKTYALTIHKSSVAVPTTGVIANELTFGVPNTVNSDAGAVPPVDQSAEPSATPAEEPTTVSEAQPPETV